MSIYFYNIKERKFLTDEYVLLFELNKGEFSENESGHLVIKTKIENFVKVEYDIDELLVSSIEITIFENGNELKEKIPNFTLEDCKIDKFTKDVTLIFTPY